MCNWISAVCEELLRTRRVGGDVAFTLLLLASPLAGQQPQTPPAPRRAPVNQVDVPEVPIHDPVLIRQDKTFYLFGTGNGVETWSSSNLQSWKRVGPVFTGTPAWIADVVPGFRGNGLWAPDIIEQNSRYYLYYSASSFGRNGSGIGVASNATLDPADARFKWEDHGLLVQSVPGRDMWNAIDPHVVIDSAGAPWLSFGSHWGGIKIVKLDATLRKLAEPQDWRTIAARDRYWKLDERDAGDSANPELKYDSIYPARITELNRASQSGAIEAPVIYRRNGWYYLFVSWDRCCRGATSTYKVVVGRSHDIKGPYLDREGERMEWGGGSLVAQGFGTSERWAAGGHNDVIEIDGKDYLVFHAYDKTDEGRSKLLVRPITWDAYGWPTVDVDLPGRKK